MKLVFLRPLGIDQDIGVSRKLIAPQVGAAIVSAGANLAQAGASAGSAAAASHQGRVYARWALHQQEAENERARQFQHAESSLARQWEEQMYNLYNSPSAMMRQYKEAGLNPYLAGQDALGSGMSQSAPMSGPGASGLSPGQPQQFVPDWSGLGNVGQSFAQALGVMAQVENIDAKTRQTNVETFKDLYYNVSPQAAYKFADSNGLFVDKGAAPSLMERSLTEDIYKKVNENAYYGLANTIMETYGKDEAKKKLDVLDKTLSKLDEDIALVKSQKDLNEKKGYELGSEIARNLAAAGLDQAIAKQYRELLDLIKSRSQLDLGLLGIQFLSGLAEFEGDEEVRDYMTSPEGKSRRGMAYKMTPEGNYVLGIMRGLRGLKDNLPNISPYIGKPKGSMNINSLNYFQTPWSTYAK